MPNAPRMHTNPLPQRLKEVQSERWKNVGPATERPLWQHEFISDLASRPECGFFSFVVRVPSTVHEAISYRHVNMGGHSNHEVTKRVLRTSSSSHSSRYIVKLLNSLYATIAKQFKYRDRLVACMYR